MLNGVIHTKKDIHTAAGTFTESTMVTTPDHGHVRKLINAALAGSIYKGKGKDLQNILSLQLKYVHLVRR